MQESELVLVSGASGYIAGFIIKQLLEKGYHVRGTVRGLPNDKKYDYLRALAPSKDALELVQADLTSPKNWDNAVAGQKNTPSFCPVHTTSHTPTQNGNNRL